MHSLARIRDGLWFGDLRWLERPESIAVYLMETRDGLAVIDPGPTSCGEGLREALEAAGAHPRDLRHVLLTHIHFDHAGITGGLARANPRLRVYVHERGAPHLVDPSRLVASATRLYGDALERLWGEFLPVDRTQLQVLGGGELLGLGQRKVRVAYTPGHAVHHVAYLEEHEGQAWVGDLAGECSQHGTPVIPAAPPPDVDLPAWRASLDLLLEWRPVQLLLTHFGPVANPQAHVTQLWTRLEQWVELVRATLEEPGTDEERAQRFTEAERERLLIGLSTTAAEHIDPASLTASWLGLSRFLRNQARPTPGTSSA
jgi:glyoxylase-like metal-dependent hydrolase (beta-lactamase superfamily II)